MVWKIVFPWEKLEPGQGFFVPCLDTTRVIEAGLRDALSCRIQATATPGIRRGLIGVWFSRLTSPLPSHCAPSSQGESSSDGCHPA